MIFRDAPAAAARKELRSAFAGHFLNLQKRENDWWLTTGAGSAGVSISTFWRLRDPSRILVAVEDDEHWFGLPQPVDIEAEANAAMANLAVKDVDIDEATGDLRFAFRQDVHLEVIVTSAGYECWQAYKTGNKHSELIAFGCNRGRGFHS